MFETEIVILIIDDNEADSNLLIRYLQKIHDWNLQVYCALTSAEGLEIWNQKKPGIIIVDYLLGSENGIEIIKKFKEKGCKSEFVLLTGYGNEFVVTEALRAGASDYLNKSNLTIQILEKTIWQLAQKLESNLKINKSESKLSYILEKTSTGLVVIDESGLIVNANEPFLTMVGLNRSEDLIGKKTSDLSSMNFQNQLISIIEKCKQEGSVTDLELTFIKPNGSISYLLINALLENDIEKNTVFALCRDITDRKIYEQELNQSKIKAEEADKLKSAFLANMSHEIRTPMNAIVGFAELMGRKNLDEDEREKYIDIIKSSSNTLLNIINDIIDISKIEVGQISISKADFNMNQLILELYSTYTSFNKKQIELICDNVNDTELINIYSDPFRIRQVLVNLLDNAFKFTEKGQIQFGYKSLENNELLCYVKDTGKGIPKDKHEIIFDRFRKLEDDAQRFHKGTGLGLTISKKLIEMLDGKLWVESEQGKGSTFFFTLPGYTVIKAIRDTISKPKTISEKNVPDWSNKVIMIVEDEENNFLYLENLLKPSKAKVMWAHSGKEAVDIIYSGIKIDLILMDIKLPEMDGVTATKKIRQINNQIPIIAQTAFAMKGDGEEFIKQGCNDYLTKPIKPEELFQKLSFYL
jgi:PAS domain S-box-containing protein